MKIRWMSDKVTDGNEWEVDFIRFHTVTLMERPDGSRSDTLVMYVHTTATQLFKILGDNPQGCIPTGILGIRVFPLLPNAVFWTWRCQPLPDQRFNKFEIVEG
jgi:hypothetical protein